MVQYIPANDGTRQRLTDWFVHMSFHLLALINVWILQVHRSVVLPFAPPR